MEQEKTQSSVEVRAPDPFVIAQEHLIKITEAIKENTVALVEMGIKIQKLENSIDLLLSRKRV